MPEPDCFLCYRISHATLNFTSTHVFTRSSAVAERPRDASCLSVVSFNIPTARFFITSYCGFRFTSAQNFIMAWLPDGEKISKISLFVLTQLTNVTDTQTDGRTDGQTPHDSIGRAYASHRARAAKTMYQYCTEKIDQSRLQG